MVEPRDAEAIGEEDDGPSLEEAVEAAEAPPEPVEDAEELPADVHDGAVEDDEGEP